MRQQVKTASQQGFVTGQVGPTRALWKDLPQDINNVHMFLCETVLGQPG